MIATIVPASSLPRRAAEVSGPARYERPSRVTRPKPPLASAGVSSQVEVTFQLPVLPLLSRARTRNAYPSPVAPSQTSEVALVPVSQLVQDPPLRDAWTS